MAGCPTPPNWQPITAERKELWLAANLAIEQAYKNDNGESGVLVGSDFVGTGGFGMSRLKLPSNAPNKEFGDYLLDRLNSTKNESIQRQPDIVDFNKNARSFYEIKPARQYIREAEKVIRQHRSLYELAARTVDEFNQMKRETNRGGSLALQDSWTMDNSKWLPPETLPLPGGGGNVVICTAATRAAYAKAPGVILYELWRRVKREDETVQQPSQVVVVEKDSSYDKLLLPQGALAAQLKSYDPYEPEHLVLIPKALYDSLKSASSNSARPDNRTAAPSSNTETALVVGAIVVATIAGIFLFATGIGEAIVIGEAVEAADLAVATRTAGIAARGARLATPLAESSRASNVISMAGKNLIANSEGASLSRAAGVLLVVGNVQKAAANDTKFSQVSAVRLVPLSSVTPYQGQKMAFSGGICAADPPDRLPLAPFEVSVGDTVMFDSEPYHVAARVVPSPNYLEK